MEFVILKLDAKGYRKFGFLTASIFVVLFGLFLPWALNYYYPTWPWVLAAALSAMALLMPLSLGPAYIIWMKFGYVMNWINTRLILGILFYGMFLPMGMLLKLFGRVPIPKKFNNRLETYRKQCHKKSKENMEHPF